MSNPFAPIDWTQQYGLNSELYQRELAAYHAAQNQRLSQTMQMFGAPAQGPTPTQQASGLPASPAWHDEDLVGAATYWGIPEEVARAMPREQLIDVVNQKRTASRAEGVSMASEILAPLGMFGVGAGEAITGGVQRLPLVGDWFARQKIVHDADLSLRQLEEGVRASVPEGEQGLLSAANIAGNVATLWYPTGTIFKFAEGVAGAVPFVARTAIGRAAFAGGASTYLLAGGSQEFKDHPVTDMMFGAAMGAGFKALQPLVEQAAGRVAKWFVPAEIQPATPEASPYGAPAQQDFGSQLSAGEQQLALPPGFPPEASPAIPMGRAYHEAGPIPTRLALPAGDPSVGDFAYLPPFGQSAGRDLAAQMNKVGTIIESPALPEIASRTELGEEAVAQAALASNPGGTNIVQGISDPSKLLQQFGGNVRFVQRGTRLDALFGDLSDRQIAQYEQHGVYEGQHVLTPEGNQVIVDGIHEFPASINDYDSIVASVQHPANVTPMQAEPLWPVRMLTPLTSSPESAPVPGAWELFNEFADQKARLTNQELGASLAPEHILATRQQNLQQYLTEFLSQVANPAERAKVEQYLNNRYIESFKPLAPMEDAWRTHVLQFKARVTAEANPTPLESLDQLAGIKGFAVIPDGRTGQIHLSDTVNEGADQAMITLKDMDEAHQFITSLNRDLPDITPQSSVPFELAGSLPSESRQVGPQLVRDEHLIQAMAASEHADILPTSPGLSGDGGLVDQGGGAGGGGGEGLPPGVVSGGGGEPPETPGPETAEVRNLVRDGRLMEAMQRVTTGAARWRPFSTLVGQWDTLLRSHGYDTGIAADYAKALYAHDLNVTWKAPWQRELGTILSKARRSIRDNGTWTRIWQIQDPGERIAAGLNARLTKAELASMDEADAVLDRLYGPGSGREMADYVSYVAERQSSGIGDKSWEEYQHGAATSSFGEVYKTSAVNLRDISPDLLFSHIIGAEGWTQHMAELYDQVKPKWQEISKQLPELKPVSDLFGNWLQSMRYGYQPMDSTALDAGHAFLQAILGPEVTQQQARQIFGGGLNLTQQALLGFKPHVIVRDGLRFAFALPKVGIDLLHSINSFMTGGREIQENMWRFAMDRGIVTQQAAPIQAPGYFEAPASPMGGPETILGGEGGSLRHKVAQTLYYTIADNLPSWMRDPSPSRLSPLYWVGKQAEMMRMLVGNAQYGKTMRALDAFRAAGETGSTDQLLGDSAMRTVPRAFQNVFLQHVASGNNDAAATFAARTMVDQTMFRYGHLEAPLVAKSISGRIALQLGNFGLHTFQYVKTGMTEGTTADKARMLVALGGVSAALAAAQDKTGWKFVRMSPLHGMGFTGGPWLEPAVDILGDINATLQYAQGTDTPTNRQGFEGLLRAPMAALGMLNPAAGLVRDAEAIGTASESPSPGMAMLRYATTGEVNNQPDIATSLAGQFSAAFQASLHTMQTPVRSSAWGTTEIPQQVPTYSPWVASPQQQLRDLPQAPDYLQP